MKKRTFIALLTTLVMGAALVPGTALAADGFAASAYPATVVGFGNGEQVFQLGAGEFTCSGSEITGELLAASEELSTGVSESTCSNYGYSGPMQANGCRYELRPETSSLTIGPAGCGPIQIKTGACTYKIGAQTLPATYTNTGKGTVALAVSTNSLQYTREKGAICSAGSGSNGHYEAKWTLQANGLITLSVEDIAVGVFLTGKESETPSEQPKLEAEKYPSRLWGEQSKPYGLKIGISNYGPAECESARFQRELTQQAADIAVTPLYSNCAALGLKTTAKTNSCGFEFHVSNVGPPYAATMDVDCTVAGDGIEFDNAYCNVKIPAQSSLGTIALTNTGEGVDRGVAMGFNVKSLQYSLVKKNIFCPASSGSFSNGTVTGTVNWRGLR